VLDECDGRVWEMPITEVKYKLDKIIPLYHYCQNMFGNHIYSTSHSSKVSSKKAKWTQVNTSEHNWTPELVMNLEKAYHSFLPLWWVPMYCMHACSAALFASFLYTILFSIHTFYFLSNTQWLWMAWRHELKKSIFDRTHSHTLTYRHKK
jgi:hypothetical protein